MKPMLYLTIGLPRSGKTTWVRRQNIPMVNPDSIRLAIHGKAFDLKHEDIVWWTAKIMVESLFIAGHKVVVLDATNVTKARRDRWISEDWDRTAVVFAEPNLELLKGRAVETPALAGVIDRMAKQFEPITSPGERFESIIDGYTTKVIRL